MRADDITAMALAGPEDIYYLIGLDHLGYFAFTLLVLPVEAGPVLITRAMERPTIRAQVPWCRHVTFHDDEEPGGVAAAAVAETVSDDAKVVLDEDSIFFPPAVAAKIKAGLPHVRWTSGTEMLTGLRAVKSPAEIGAVRQAAAISDRAIEAGIAAARPGIAEPTVAAEIYSVMIASGGQSAGFPPLIRPTSMLDQEHVSWSDRTIQPGQGLFLELSASVRRYHAPQSRTIYVDSVPSGAAEAAEAALAGLNAARETLRPEATTGEVYTAWQQEASGADHTPTRHHCGYLIGIGFPPAGSEVGKSSGSALVVLSRSSRT